MVLIFRTPKLLQKRPDQKAIVIDFRQIGSAFNRSHHPGLKINNMFRTHSCRKTKFLNV